MFVLRIAADETKLDGWRLLADPFYGTLAWRFLLIESRDSAESIGIEDASQELEPP